jgi:hypothetical protein
MKMKHLSYLGIFCLASFAGGALAQAPPSTLEFEVVQPGRPPSGSRRKRLVTRRRSSIWTVSAPKSSSPATSKRSGGL